MKELWGKIVRFLMRVNNDQHELLASMEREFTTGRQRPRVDPVERMIFGRL